MSGRGADPLAATRRALASGRARRLREALGFTQADLARIARIPASEIARWESGETRPLDQDALRYRKAFQTLARRARLRRKKPRTGA